LPYVIDLESVTSVPPNHKSNVLAFLQTIENNTGQKPVIYTNYDYWNTYMGDLDWSLDYLLWIANYTHRFGPLVPDPWHPDQWTYWQYSKSGKGSRYGCPSNYVDLNLARIIA